MKYKELILHPIFITGLLVLILNDLILKWYFSNVITGKLSDFSGLLILPIFISYFLARTRKSIALIIGILFVIWKSHLSSPVIEYINSLSFFRFRRVVDYTDLMALTILPVSHYVINGELFKTVKKRQSLRYYRSSILLISSIAFISTSMARHEMPQGTVFLGKAITIKMSKNTLLNKIDSLGYDCYFKNDTIQYPEYSHSKSYYQINNLILSDDDKVIDTLRNIKFLIREMNKNKVKIELINVELKKPGNIQDWKYLRWLNRYYKKEIGKFIKEEIR